MAGLSYQDPLLAQFGATGLFRGAGTPGYPSDFDMTGIFGNSPLAMIASQMMSMVAGPMMQSNGIMPGAMFGSSQNYLDQMRARAYYDNLTRSTQEAAKGDVNSMLTMYQNATGAPAGAGARTFINDISGVLPIIGQMAPGTVDALFGSRGSMSVMAQGIHEGMRFRTDPFTGNFGATGGGYAGKVAAEMSTQFFGDTFDATKWNGLGAGSAGALYKELSARGMMGGVNLGSMSNEERIRTLANSAGMSESQVRGMDTAGIEKLTAGFDANQIGTRLQNLSGAVKAMREIFGDLGKPDAPMAEIITGLNQLTQGGMATMSTAQLERTVRMTQSLAQTTGIGIQGIQAMAATAAATTDALGMERTFAIQSAQGAAAFGSAFGAVGGTNYAAYGRRDVENLTMQDQQLRVRAAASEQANRFNVLMRLRDERGLTGPAAEMAAAVAAGQTTFGDANQSVFMDQSKFLSMLKSSGVDHTTAMSMLQDRFTNQEYGLKYGTGDLTRMNQRSELLPYMQNAFKQAARGAMGDLGITDPEQAKAKSQAIAAAATDALNKMDPKDYTNTGERNKKLAEAMANAAGYAGKIEDMPPELRQQFTEMAMTGWGNYETNIRLSPGLRHLESAVNSLDATSPAALREQQARMRQASTDASLRTTLAPYSGDGLLKETANFLLEGGSAKDLATKLAGKNPADIARITSMLNVQDTTRTALLDIESRIKTEQEHLEEATKSGDRAGATKARSAIKELEAERAQSMDVVSGVGAGGSDARKVAETIRKKYSGQAMPDYIRRQLDSLDAAARGQGLVGLGTAADKESGALDYGKVRALAKTKGMSVDEVIAAAAKDSEADKTRTTGGEGEFSAEDEAAAKAVGGMDKLKRKALDDLAAKADGDTAAKKEKEGQAGKNEFTIRGSVKITNPDVLDFSNAKFTSAGTGSTPATA